MASASVASASVPSAGVISAGALTTRCRAKINLTLRVLARRPDGYHELDSLVAFAGVGDALTLEPGPELGLSLAGPFGEGLAAEPDNLVLVAARALARERDLPRRGRFHLVKRLPIASGIGGGSANAAGALRLLARLNGFAENDPALFRAAAKIGADVPVCLASGARMMSGLGETLGPPLALPPLFAVLVNPGVGVATAAVFQKLGLQPGERFFSQAGVRPEAAHSGDSEGDPEGSGDRQSVSGAAVSGSHSAFQPEGSHGKALDRAALMAALASSGNDLEAPARGHAAIIGDVLQALAALPGCRLARMSGSGATCFALFDDCRRSAAAAMRLREAQTGWWIKATVLR